MTQHVLLTIIGRQGDPAEDADTVLTAEGEYFFRNGRHYVLYSEPEEDDGPLTDKKNDEKSMIRISEGRVDVLRRGGYRVHMVFECGRPHVTDYHTPAGDMMMETDTAKIETGQTPQEIRTDIRYALYLNSCFISDCLVKIRIAEIAEENGD